MSEVLILISGGIDSFACGHFLLANNFKVSGLFVDYGQQAAIAEVQSAKQVARMLGIELRVARLSSDQIFRSGEILGRNMFLLGTALLLSTNIPSAVAMGLHSATPYYDSSRVFADRMSIILSEYTSGRTSLFVPFISWSKAEVVEYAKASNLCLAATYSCEEGPTPCGQCLSCLDRKAFLAG